MIAFKFSKLLIKVTVQNVRHLPLHRTDNSSRRSQNFFWLLIVACEVVGVVNFADTVILKNGFVTRTDVADEVIVIIVFSYNFGTEFFQWILLMRSIVRLEITRCDFEEELLTLLRNNSCCTGWLLVKFFDKEVLCLS